MARPTEVHGRNQNGRGTGRQVFDEIVARSVPRERDRHRGHGRRCPAAARSCRVRRPVTDRGERHVRRQRDDRYPADPAVCPFVVVEMFERYRPSDAQERPQQRQDGRNHPERERFFDGCDKHSRHGDGYDIQHFRPTQKRSGDQRQYADGRKRVFRVNFETRRHRFAKTEN